jgi:hypothetical protein
MDGLGAGGGGDDGGGGVVSSDEGVGSGVAGGVVWAVAATSVEARTNTAATTAPAATRHEGVHIAGPGLPPRPVSYPCLAHECFSRDLYEKLRMARMRGDRARYATARRGLRLP